MNEDTKTLIKQTTKSVKTNSQPKDTTVDDLKKQFDIARGIEDWKNVSRLAREITKAEKTAVDAKREALIKQSSFLRDCFRNAIEGAINEVCDNLSEEELRLVEGVWLSRDFGNGDFDVRIVKDRIKGKTKG